MLASAPLFPKFVSNRAAMYHELRKRGTSRGPIARPALRSVSPAWIPRVGGAPLRHNCGLQSQFGLSISYGVGRSPSLRAVQPMIAVSSALKPTAVATLLVAGLAAAHAQGRDQGASQDRGRLESLENDTSEFFGRIFSGSDRFNRKPAPVQTAQVSASELVVRLDRLENQVRQLTGMVEQLQYRNQQLEQQLRRGQEDGGDGRPPLRPQAAPPVLPQAAPSMPPVGSPPPPQRRADVFPGDD